MYAAFEMSTLYYQHTRQEFWKLPAEELLVDHLLARTKPLSKHVYRPRWKALLENQRL